MRDLNTLGLRFTRRAPECRLPPFFTALLILGMTGCVALPRPTQTTVQHTPAPAGFPAHIAVLPLNNGTSDTEGPILVRAFAIRALSRELGFIVPSAEETDNSLSTRDLIWPGHPQGRQLLSRQNPAVVASWLGVEGLLHGELTAYSSQTLSFYTEKKVKVHFWLTDATGKKIWESQNGDSGGGGISMGSASMENILSDGSLSPEVQERVRRSALAEPAFSAVNSAFADFPRRS